MKSIKSILILVLILVLTWSCKEKTSETAPKAIVKKEIKPENLQKTSFNVEGMTCAIGCAKTIQEELSNQEGVQEAKVDFDKKLATVSYDKTLQTPEDLAKVVEKVGDGKTYTVTKL